MSVSDPASPVQEGDVIAGKYRVERVLGVGGMGVVVAATHLDLEQRVALKFLLPQAAASTDVAARFLREARAAVKIHSEHVAKVIDVGTTPDGAPYMVMEYMDGEDFEQILSRGGPLPIEDTVGYALEACEAIAEAHALGVVHRDLKPANLFLAKRSNGPPIVKVLDFGISKSMLDTSKAQLTKTSAIMGSPLYMSPEQMASARSVDTRSDIWAIGVVIYELLSGRAPFVAESMPELIAAVLQAQHAPLATLRPEVSSELDAVVQRCLEKDPARRFASVAELAEALAPFGPPRSDVSVERIRHVLLRATTDGRVPGAAGSGPGLPRAAPVPRSASALESGPTIAVQAKTNAPWALSTSQAVRASARRTHAAKVAAGVLVVACVAVAAFLGIRPRQAARAGRRG